MRDVVVDGLLVWCLGAAAGAAMCLAAEAIRWLDDVWEAHRAHRRRRAIRRTLAEADTMSLVDWARKAS